MNQVQSYRKQETQESPMLIDWYQIYRHQAYKILDLYKPSDSKCLSSPNFEIESKVWFYCATFGLVIYGVEFLLCWLHYEVKSWDV